MYIITWVCLIRLKIMFCSNCGKEIDDNSKFCPECGKAVANANIKKEKKTKCPKCGYDDINISNKGYNGACLGCGFFLGLILLLFISPIAALAVFVIFALFGLVGSSENIWICKQCGTKWDRWEWRQRNVINKDIKETPEQRAKYRKIGFLILLPIIIIMLIVLVAAILLDMNGGL